MSGAIGLDPKAKKSVEWYTPKWIFDAMGIEFDMDPSSPHDHETFVPATKKLTKFDDGLSQLWLGRVWMNPPYGKETGEWMSKFCQHRNGICLVFSRTDAQWFQNALDKCDAVLLLAGRISFIPGHENKHKASRSGAGSAMFACGDECVKAMHKLSDKGHFIDLSGGWYD